MMAATARRPPQPRADLLRFGRELAAARERAGFPSQEALATRLAVHTSTVSRWEQGRSAPRGETLANLMAALGESGATLLQLLPGAEGAPRQADHVDPSDEESVLVGLFRALRPEMQPIAVDAVGAVALQDLNPVIFDLVAQIPAERRARMLELRDSLFK